MTRSVDLLTRRSRSELLVAGVKVATQTPPIRSGRRVVFLTLDDGTGPVDATFFEDAQGPYAATVFHSWLLVVRGELRRTGRHGVSLRATGCWELRAARALAAGRTTGWRGARGDGRRCPRASAPRVEAGGAGAAESRATRPVMAPSRRDGPGRDRRPAPTAGGMGRRRVLVHSSGFTDVAVRRHQARRRGRQVGPPRRASCGTPRPGSSGG